MGICRGNAEWAGSSPIGTRRQKWRWQCTCSMVNSYICDSLWYFTPFALHKLLFPCKLSILSWTCLLWYPPLLHSPLVPASAYTVEGHFFWVGPAQGGHVKAWRRRNPRSLWRDPARGMAWEPKGLLRKLWTLMASASYIYPLALHQTRCI